MNFSQLGISDNLVYGSKRIFERRLRILEEAQKLIADEGFEKFRMRELCSRAEVTPHTIYKAFGSKERLVALAIRHQFESFETKYPLKYPQRSLQGVLERVIVGHATMLGMKEYVKAVTCIYFSLTVDDDLREAAAYNVILTLLPWARHLENQGHLRSGLSATDLVEQIIRLKFTISLDWCRNGISDEVFLEKKVRAVLGSAAGLTVGAGYREINDYLVDFSSSRTIFETFRKDVSQAAVGTLKWKDRLERGAGT
jgi:AcrR family transcriptional regulator